MTEVLRLNGADGIKLAADAVGPEGGLPVVMLHGGGQTRGSWRNGVSALAGRGYRVFSLDTRGHGESDWDPQEDYSLDALVRDLRAALTQLPPNPALIGASMGGITALLTLGEDDAPAVRALVLVDVTPKLNRAGVLGMISFMRANLGGFATLEEAADAVSAYNPHRPRPKDISGLRRNLREVDGRLYWHWDPAFLGHRAAEPGSAADSLSAAAQKVRVPTLLVRGRESELVGEEEVAHFRQLMPQAGYVDVAGAGHMVAGDRNDAFNQAIIDFIERVDSAGSPR